MNILEPGMNEGNVTIDEFVERYRAFAQRFMTTMDDNLLKAGQLLRDWCYQIDERRDKQLTIKSEETRGCYGYSKTFILDCGDPSQTCRVVLADYKSRGYSLIFNFDRFVDRELPPIFSLHAAFSNVNENPAFLRLQKGLGWQRQRFSYLLSNEPLEAHVRDRVRPMQPCQAMQLLDVLANKILCVDEL